MSKKRCCCVNKEHFPTIKGSADGDKETCNAQESAKDINCGRRGRAFDPLKVPVWRNAVCHGEQPRPCKVYGPLTKSRHKKQRGAAQAQSHQSEDTLGPEDACDQTCQRLPVCPEFRDIACCGQVETILDH